MFTGVVEGVGRIEAIEGDERGRDLWIEAADLTAGLGIGASIAVDGACLTATAIDGDRFAVHTVVETLRRTTLGELEPGSHVNLERAMSASGRFDGHLVQGHVDEVGRVVAIEPEGEGRRLTVEVSPQLRRYVVEKGSVTVNGVSLTVATLEADGFSVALIPHTLVATTLGRVTVGRGVNVEADILAKYVERLLEAR